MTNPTLMTEAPSPSAAEASQAAPAGGTEPATAPAAADNATQQPAAASTTEPAAQDAPGADTKAEGEQKPAEGDKPAGAPEKYEFKAPEGVALDPVLLGEFEGIARELDLPQDKAQSVVDKLAPKIGERVLAQQAEVVQRARTEWADASKSDKEFGGDKLAENMAVVGKAMTAFGTPELRTLLDESGLGNHPEVIRAFFRAGKAISEDRPITGTVGNTAMQTQAQRMFPNMNP